MDMTDLIKFDTKEERPNIIKVVGVGGGGSNAVTHMFTEGIQGVDFILCNTDYQALEKSPVATKIHLGKRALGAGNMPGVGREAALETTEEIRDILSKDTKMLFITAGMGGGTGTGAAPIVASIAKELDILTVGIVTLPFSFEGKRRQQQAIDGIAELRNHVDTLLVISNDKLRDEYGDMKLTQAFKKADDVLKTAAKGIAEIITVTGYVNVDFQDVNTVMRRSGKAIMGSGYAEGEGRALKAVEIAVNSPLLDDSEIIGAKNILIYITSGSNEVSLDEVNDITHYVQKKTGYCSDVIWGNGEDDSLGEGINVTLIATGFSDDENNYDNEQNTKRNSIVHDMFEEATKPKNKNNENIAPQQKEDEGHQDNDIIDDDKPYVRRHVLYDDNYNIPLERNVNVEEPMAVSEKTQSKGYHNPFTQDNDDDDDLGIKTYIKDNINDETQVAVKPIITAKKEQTEELTQQEIMRRQRLSFLSMGFKSMSNIEEMETQPAYKRMGIKFSEDNDSDLSSYSSDKEKGLRENNSFLHNNVD